MREDGRISRNGDVPEIDDTNDWQSIVDSICNGDDTSEEITEPQDLLYC